MLERNDKPIPGGRNWVPWVGLALVLPALLVFLVAISGFIASTERGPSGQLRIGDGVGVMGIGGGFVVGVAAFAGLMLGILGLVRASRRQYPRDGSNIGIAGGILDVGVIVLAIVGLLSLVWLAM